MVAATAGFQPRIEPASPANRNRAGPDFVPSALLTTNPVLPLKTVPVGSFATVTVNGTFEPVPVYSVESPVPLSDTHQGEVALAEIPQPLTRDGSTRSAGMPPFETRLWTV